MRRWKVLWTGGVLGVALGLGGCAAACREGDPILRRNGSGWCQGGRRLGNARALDSLLRTDTASASLSRRATGLQAVGAFGVALPGGMIGLWLLSSGQAISLGVAAGVGLAGGAVGLPVLGFALASQHEAICRFNRARGDSTCGAPSVPSAGGVAAPE